jgi:hypothetical protein
MAESAPIVSSSSQYDHNRPISTYLFLMIMCVFWNTNSVCFVQESYYILRGPKGNLHTLMPKMVYYYYLPQMKLEFARSSELNHCVQC